MKIHVPFLYAKIFIFLFLLLLAHALRAFLSSYNRSSRAEIARRKCPHVPLMYAAVLPLLFQLYLTYSPSFFIRCHPEQKPQDRSVLTYLYVRCGTCAFISTLSDLFSELFYKVSSKAKTARAEKFTYFFVR